MKSIIEYGRTANMGNFESIRIAKSLEVNAPNAKELDKLCEDAYDLCMRWVENKIKQELSTRRPERR